MAGCFGGSPVDMWMERNLHRYLDDCEDSIEELENEYGTILAGDSDTGFLFKDGYFGDESKIQNAKYYETKNGKYLVKIGSYTWSSRAKRKVFKSEKFITLEP